MRMQEYRNRKLHISTFIKEIHLALLFFTRLPVGNIEAPVPSLAQSSWCWSLVGGVTGLLAALVYSALSYLGVPLILAAFVTTFSLVAVTGAIHEDGLADTADSFGTSNPDKKLEIMSDSRVGSFGAIALFFSIGIRVSALALIENTALAAISLIAIAMASRSCLPFLVWALPPVKSSGMGQSATGISFSNVIICSVSGIILFPLLPYAALLIAAILVITGLSFYYLKYKFRGYTGDHLGAVQQVIEIACWIILATLFQNSLL